MAIIKCENIVKSFGHPPIRILKSLTFDIEKGEFLAVTGRSGSGKSTLLYVISGLDDLTSGQISISGENIHELGNKELHNFRNNRMGFVFQFHYMLPELTALENILMPARKFGHEKEKKEYALHLMEHFKVIECKKKLPSQMSGGEMQRTSLARALIMNPEILFADEPTGNLDSENGGKVMEIFKQINKEMGTTIMMVTHEEDYAKLASRRIHLIDGIISEDTSTSAGKKESPRKGRAKGAKS